MLVLTVKKHEPIWIGDDVCVFLCESLGPDKVRIGVEAPRDVRILRDCVKERMKDTDGLHGDS